MYKDLIYSALKKKKKLNLLFLLQVFAHIFWVKFKYGIKLNLLMLCKFSKVEFDK